MTDAHFLWSGWEAIFHIVVVGTFSYLFLLFSLRASGPRTVGKTNIFDFIVSVAIGGVFGRCITQSELSISEAVTAFALLVGLQHFFSWMRSRSARIRHILDCEPHLLYFQGRYLESALAETRATRSDITEAVRLKGLGSMDDVEAVILEGNGEFAVVNKGATPPSLVKILADK